jgi:hypothetical protein
MDDRQEIDYYRDETHQVPGGPGHSRQGPRLSATTPVRFPQEMIAAVRRLAVEDGVTVSAWIRRVVGKEIQRRQPPQTATTFTAFPPVRFDDYTGAPGTMTVAEELSAAS